MVFQGSSVLIVEHSKAVEGKGSVIRVIDATSEKQIAEQHR